MKNFTLIIMMSSAVIACGSGTDVRVDPADINENGVNWVKRGTSGFVAIVGGSFTVKNMQATFGNYCERNNKVMRSLRMNPEENGTQRVIGDCL